MKRKWKGRLFGLVVAVTLLLAALPAGAQMAKSAAAGETRDNPIVYTGEEGDDFPRWPAAGSLAVEQTAQWADEECTVGAATLDLAGQPLSGGMDYLVLLDASAGMGWDTADGNPCLNPAHEKVYSFTRYVTYYYRLTSSGRYDMDKAEITVTLRCHQGSVLERVSVAGFEEAPFYATNTNGANSWRDWNNGSSSASYLINAFANQPANEDAGVTFPVSLDTGAPVTPEEGCSGRLGLAKELLPTLADTLLGRAGAATPNRLQVVTVGTGTSFFSGGFSGGDALAAIRESISGVEAGGEADYGAALRQAAAVLDGRGADEGNPVAVIFLSGREPGASGLPAPDDVEALRSRAGPGVYALGLGPQTEASLGLLQSVAQPGGVCGEAAELLEAITSLGGEALPAARETLVTVTQAAEGGEGDFAPILPGDEDYSEYPITLSGGEEAARTLTAADFGPGGLFGYEDGTLGWEAGDIPAGGFTLQYHVRGRAGMEPGEYPVNSGALLNYKNIRGNYCERTFEGPLLSRPGGRVQYLYYEVDGTGAALAADGGPLAEEVSLTALMERGRVLHTGYATEGDSIELPTGAGRAYRVETPAGYCTEDAGSYLRYGTQVLAASGDQAYTANDIEEADGRPCSPAYPLEKSGDGWVVLVPYLRSYTLTYDANGGEVDSLPPPVQAGAGEIITLATEPAPVRAEGGGYRYTFDGWSTRPGGENEAGRLTRVTLPAEEGDLTVYAIWARAGLGADVEVNYYEEDGNGALLGSYTIGGVGLGSELAAVLEEYRVPVDYAGAVRAVAEGEGSWVKDKEAVFSDTGILLENSMTAVSAEGPNRIDIAFPRREAAFTVRYWLGAAGDGAAGLGSFRQEAAAGLPVSRYEIPTDYEEAESHCGGDWGPLDALYDPQGVASVDLDTLLVSAENDTVVDIVYPLRKVGVRVEYYRGAVSEETLLGGCLLADIEAGSPVTGLGIETGYSGAKTAVNKQAGDDIDQQMKELGGNYIPTAVFEDSSLTVSPAGDAVARLVFPRKVSDVRVEYYQGDENGPLLGGYTLPNAPVGDALRTLDIPTAADAAAGRCPEWTAPDANHDPSGRVVLPQAGLDVPVDEGENLVMIVFPVYRVDVEVSFYEGDAGGRRLGGYTIEGVAAGSALKELEVPLDDAGAKERCGNWAGLSEFYEPAGVWDEGNAATAVYGQANAVEVAFPARQLYTLRYDAGGTDVTGLPETQQWYAGKRLAADPGWGLARPCHTFTGWGMSTQDAAASGYAPDENSSYAFTMPAGDITLTAGWRQNVVQAGLAHTYTGGDGKTTTREDAAIAAGVEVDVFAGYAQKQNGDRAYTPQHAIIEWERLPRLTVIALPGDGSEAACGASLPLAAGEALLDHSPAIGWDIVASFAQGDILPTIEKWFTREGGRESAFDPATDTIDSDTTVYVALGWPDGFVPAQQAQAPAAPAAPGLRASGSVTIPAGGRFTFDDGYRYTIRFAYHYTPAEAGPPAGENPPASDTGTGEGQAAAEDVVVGGTTQAAGQPPPAGPTAPPAQVAPQTPAPEREEVSPDSGTAPSGENPVANAGAPGTPGAAPAAGKGSSAAPIVALAAVLAVAAAGVGLAMYRRKKLATGKRTGTYPFDDEVE